MRGSRAGDGEGQKRLRCAIYTRKSTEEGLDQEFNSLDAQREACFAYITSQRHEGWSLIPERYDDGGFSGGNMHRPALKRLIADVRAGKVDVIVVYKVDRLTRVLSDFAKIVEALDEAGSSFVSITQAFNTTTSMGRLTLNVLLSFAQFEREVISERVRDKIAASKARGMWMGGAVPLGYDVQDRRLAINQVEAETVRHVMRRYLDLKSVPRLMEDLKVTGVKTKRQRMRDGSFRGGLSFVRGPLYHLLKNRIYRGEIVHKGKVYPGNHEAIVDSELFNAVQEQLASTIADRRSGNRAAHPSLLTGMIRDEADRPLSPAHTTKGGIRYRYYVSNIAAPGDVQVTPTRIPARALELAVLRGLKQAILSVEQCLDGIDNLHAELLQRVRHGRSALLSKLDATRGAQLRSLLVQLDLAIRLYDDRAEASCCRRRLLTMMDQSSDWSGIQLRLRLTMPTSLRRRGHELRLRIDPPADRPNRSPKLINLIIRAHAAREELHSDAYSEPSQKRRELSRTARLSYLAPDITTAIFEGRHPNTLGARKLERLGDLPICWKEQRRVLGFS